MILTYAALFVLCLFGMRFHKEQNEQYLGKEQTGAIKGVFVVTVFLSHVIQYFSLNENTADTLFDLVMGLLGQNIVIAFLLYSGYGIGRAYLAKGRDYMKQLPRNRILSIWVHFALAVLLFWIVDLTLIHGGYSPLDYFLSLFAWVSVGNSTWFVFAILLCWILTCVCFLIFRNKYHALGALAGLLCVYIVAIAYIKNDHAWYDTVLCYPLGLLVAFRKEQFDKSFRSGIRAISAIGALGVAWVVLRLFVEKNIVLYEVQSVLFALFLLAFTSRVGIGNKCLAWLGKHSFSLYILQRIPMLILDRFGLSEWNRWVFVLVSAVATGLIAWGFDEWVMKPINQKLQKRTVRV